MLSRGVALVAAAAAFLMVTSPALADRAANAAEKREIAREAGFPARCLDVRISTINRRWASAFLRRCNLGNGSAVYRRSANGWVNVFMGPDDKEPCRTGVEGVPTRIARDLRICR